MNDRVLAFLVFLLGYRVEVLGWYMAFNGDLTAIWMVSLGILFTFLSCDIDNRATQ